MQTLNFKLGIIQNVNVAKRTIDIIDITTSNLSSVNYQNVYFADIQEHQVIPQVGYMVLFATISAVAGMQSIVIPIRYFSTVSNGDEEGSTKQRYSKALQEQSDQVFTSNGGATLALLNQAAILNIGSQTITLDNSKSKTTVKYDSLEINGSDGFKIRQDQGTNTLEITKGKTVIRIKGDSVDVIADNVNVISNDVKIGGENTVKGQSLLQWLNTHTHSNGNNGNPTGPVMVQAQDKTLLVEGQE